MPVWMQILIPTVFVLLSVARNRPTPPSADTAKTEADATRLWRTYYAVQNCVISLNRSIESVDATLGVLMVIIVTAFFYQYDKANEAGTHAQIVHEPVAAYPFVFAWLLLIPLVLAFIAAVRLTPEEPLDARAFVDSLQQNEAHAIRTMLGDMVGVYDRNFTLRSRKQLALFLVVAMVGAILILGAAWPQVWSVLASVGHHLLFWRR